MIQAAPSALAVYNAQPSVLVDGAPDDKVSELLLTMEMRERETGLAGLELRFSNVASDTHGGADYAFEDDAVLRLGAELTVLAGDVVDPSEVFRGTVTGLEAEFRRERPAELVVLAEDALQRARMTRRTKLHEEATLSGILTDLASEVGLQPVVRGLQDAIGTQVQLNESDLAFVRRVLRSYDADLQVVGNELHAALREEVQRGELELVFNDNLYKLDVVADLAHQVTTVTACGWDPDGGGRVLATSRGARPGPGTGRPGAALLEAALGERNEHIGHLAITTADEAQKWADAAFDQRARRFVCVAGTTEGNPALRVGTHVRIVDVGPRFENTYYVVEVCHRYDRERGYECDFRAECAYQEAG